MLSSSVSGFFRRFGWLAGTVSLVAACARGTDDTALGTNGISAIPSAVFTIDLWPGEGVPVMVARRTHLLLRAAPDPGSLVVDTLQSSIGSRLNFDSTRTQTIEPGMIRVLTTVRVTGRDMGSDAHVEHDEYYDRARPEVDLIVAAPALIEYLQDRAEGTCFVRVDRRVIDADPCPAFAGDHVRIEREPVTQWWIRIRGQGGAFGWLLVSDSTARSVRREF